MTAIKNNWIVAALIGAAVIGRFLYMKNAVDLMARTMWGEGRNQGEQGMQAIGNVIKNRADRGGWWGASIVDVITRDMQFSAWNVGDPNRAKMLSVTDSNPQFKSALVIAEQLLSTDLLADITGGADHYHTSAISPYWAADMTQTAQIGDHIFYRSA